MLRRIRQDVLRSGGFFLLPYLISFLCRTLKIKIINQEVIASLEKENKNYVFGFWHGTMLVPWFIQRDKGFAALISKSKDGDLLSNVLKHWNYEVVRGSSSSGGDVALGILVDLARNKKSIAITPDGPRGPALKLKAGAVITAKKSGIPLVLAGVGYKKKKVLRSWDRFEVPLFFTKVNVVLSEAINIPRDLNYEETSERIRQCEIRLAELQRSAGIF